MSRKKRKKGRGAASPNPMVQQKLQPGAASNKQFTVIVVSVLVLAGLLGGAWWWMNRRTEPVIPESNPDNPVVLIETDRGSIKVELYPEHAPITVKNFLRYVDDKHYDGTIFHRVIENFMIQGGGFTPDMNKKPTRPEIKNESYNGLANRRGTIAMARTPEPHSASAQFFINVKDNAFLDRANAKDGYGYAVFGEVVEGMDVVDEIRSVETDTKDKPLEPVVIKSIRRVE